MALVLTAINLLTEFIIWAENIFIHTRKLTISPACYKMFIIVMHKINYFGEERFSQNGRN